MLTGLYIENIAVIQKAGIDFDSGLNVLTGETGAGKSIVIDALGAVLGERISRDVVRTGSDQAKVTAVFSDITPSCAKKLSECGFPPDEEGGVLIQRVISAEGKGSCRINGQPVTVALLREIGRLLVNIHGQHENQALLSVERHVQYLDAMGGNESVREIYAAAYREWRAVCRELEKTVIDEGEKERRLDMLRYQTEEIRGAQLRAGEMEELREKREIFRNSEKIVRSLREARGLINGGDDSDGASAMLSDAYGCVRDVCGYIESLEDIASRLQNAQYEIEECGSEIRELLSGMDFEPYELEQAEERYAVIRRAVNKYGGSEESALAFLTQAERELDDIELSDQRAAQLEKKRGEAYDIMRAHAAKLTESRKHAAALFEQNVGRELAFLDMPGVKLSVSVEPSEPDIGGADRVEFLISANPGEEPKSIAKIASGGELSRIMLAVKSVMADADDIDTLIFDEIDTGISGRAAQKVGKKLRETAANRQVLCVTHLTSIAAQAHHHYLIEKQVRDDGRTYTEVTCLSPERREQELARIIGGDITPAALEAAKEMLIGN